MKLYHLTQHFSCAKDLEGIFTKLGHTVETDSLSGHNHLMGIPTPAMPMFDDNRWCTDFVKNKKWQEFKSTYSGKGDSADAFVVTYPPVWCLLYHDWNKPIIMHIPIRYDYGVLHLPEAWQYMNSFIRERVDAGKLFLVANSKHDKYYAEHFLDREVSVIPSLCEYMGRKWNPSATRYAMYLRAGWPGLPGQIEPREAVFPDGYSWDVLNNVKAIVHFPYATSTMSVFEFYTGNFPMFIPSHEYCCQMYQQNIKSVAEPILWHWCNTKLFNPLNKPEGPKPCSPIKCADGREGVPDPNMSTQIESFRYWTKYADFFDAEEMKGIQLFNSMEHLSAMTTQGNPQYVDCQAVSNQMAAHNAVRIPRVYDAWRGLLAKVEAAK